jgi:hypothetical protein
MNARRAPGWVLRHHTEDQLPNFRRQFFLPACFLAFEIKLQYRRKTSAMPANDCIRIDEHEGLPKHPNLSESISRRQTFPLHVTRPSIGGC